MTRTGGDADSREPKVVTVYRSLAGIASSTPQFGAVPASHCATTDPSSRVVVPTPGKDPGQHAVGA